MNPNVLAKTLVAATAFGFTGIAAADPASAATTQKLEQQIDALSQQLQQLRTELQQVKAQNEALAAQQEQQAQQQSQNLQTAAKPSPLENVSLWGYGEVNYERPIHDTENTAADLARAVFGIGYRFDDRTRFNSEYEIEHAVSSASDPGEVEVEQFYVDHQLTNWAAVKGGLFLIPSGLLNLSHEPTHYYGVHRNFVESLIIPSTWREGGVGFHGDTDYGLGWDAGLTTGFNLAKWDMNLDPSELDEAAPLRASHQELALANASHLSQYLALGYNGVPGLNVGASLFTGVTTPFQPGLADERVTLWEAHTRWTPGRLDLSALYARGTISNTADANRLFPGVSNPIPASFFGYYAQGAYTVWQRNDYRIAPFLRWERFNLGHSYAGIPQGFTASPRATERVWSYGASFYLNPNVVLKADYQSFAVDQALDRFSLGLGLNF